VKPSSAYLAGIFCGGSTWDALRHAGIVRGVANQGLHRTVRVHPAF
jgi:hypothetical protein